MLTESQKILAEKHAYMVKVMVGSMIRRKPWLRRHEDCLTSAANAMLCKAARTYRDDRKLPFFAWARLVMLCGMRSAARQVRDRRDRVLMGEEEASKCIDPRSWHAASEADEMEIREHILCRMQKEIREDRRVAEMIMDGHTVSQIVRDALGKKMSGSSYTRVDRVRKIVASELSSILGEDVIQGWKNSNTYRSSTMRPGKAFNRRLRRCVAS